MKNIKLYKIFTLCNISMILICFIIGFVCSNVSNIKINKSVQQSEIKQLINVLNEWKEIDTYGK